MATRSKEKAAARKANADKRPQAHAKYIRISPRKVKIVIDLIRGKSVDEAAAILQFTPKAASPVVLKVLNSAIANAVNNQELNRVTVEGVNVVTKHQKARNAMQPGGIIHKEMPIDASNVMLVCPKCGKPTRVNNKAEKVTDDNGKTHRKLIRVCKKCGAEID